jgi:DNA-binding transcriptional ArsR family regulator
MNDQSTENQSDQRETILRAFSQAMGDPVRLKIAARLAVQPQSIAELSTSLQLPIEEIRQPLDQLVEIGLARLENDRYWLDDTSLADWIKTVHSGRKQERLVEEQEAGDAFERKTLRDFLRQDGTIKAFPAQELCVMRWQHLSLVCVIRRKKLTNSCGVIILILPCYAERWWIISIWRVRMVSTGY